MTDHWRANPFHRVRKLDAPAGVGRWGADPRVGDAERGRELGRGLWRFGAERLAGEHAIPWRAKPPSRHFAARLHSFAWLIDLAAVGPSANARIAELIDAWVEQFGDWDELAWDPELCAERLFAWLCWGRAAFEFGDAHHFAPLLACSGRHARLIFDSESELADRHLASIKAGAALALAGAAGFPDDDRLSEHGEEVLLEACSKQFHPDGGHLSRSPEALVDALADLVTACDALAEPPALILETLPKLANMVRMLRLGDGGLGCFQGGSEGSSPSIEATLARVKGEARAIQYATQSAYQRLEAGGLRVLFDVGGAPSYLHSERGHAGALAFEMSSGTERLIVNVGAQRDLSPAARVAARATNGHSTLVLADALSATLEAPRRGRGSGRMVGPTIDDMRRSADESGVTVQGRHDGYKGEFGLLHRRYLFMDHEGANLRGIDELIRPMRLKSPPPKQPIPFLVRFHLHPNTRARMAERQVALLETPGGQRWRLKTDAPGISIEHSTYWGGASPREALQIVLSGEADPMGHGLAPPNRVRWALTRAG